LGVIILFKAFAASTNHIGCGISTGYDDSSLGIFLHRRFPGILAANIFPSMGRQLLFFIIAIAATAGR
jgi:hypothetical protein